MALPCYLAMTRREFDAADTLPHNVAWMACHFSSYETGLTNLPDRLPPGSMVIVNDRTPIRGHNPAEISQQLSSLAQRLRLSGIALDFQLPGVSETAQLCRVLSKRLPCPVGVSEAYAPGLQCPVFVSALPLRCDLPTHLSAWRGRQIWLELSAEQETVTLTRSGSQCSSVPVCPLQEPVFTDAQLHCRYHWTADTQKAIFTLQRTKADFPPLLEQAEKLGVTRTIGLFQQLGKS